MENEINKYRFYIPKIKISGDNRLIYAEIFNSAKIDLFKKIFKKIVSIGSGLIFYDIEDFCKRELLLKKFYYTMDLNVRLHIYHMYLESSTSE
jgi:hypothetical protein